MLEAIGEALTPPPVVEPEVFDKLRADWTAVRTEVETARLERIEQYPEEAAALIEAWRSLDLSEKPDRPRGP